MYMASVLFLGKYLTASFFLKANKKKVKSNETFSLQKFRTVYF